MTMIAMSIVMAATMIVVCVATVFDIVVSRFLGKLTQPAKSS